MDQIRMLTATCMEGHWPEPGTECRGGCHSHLGGEVAVLCLLDDQTPQATGKCGRAGGRAEVGRCEEGCLGGHHPSRSSRGHFCCLCPHIPSSSNNSCLSSRNLAFPTPIYGSVQAQGPPITTLATVSPLGGPEAQPGEEDVGVSLRSLVCEGERPLPPIRNCCGSLTCLSASRP